MPRSTSFVDCVCLWLCAGKGGEGAVSFAHQRGRHRGYHRGGPDGGDGGSGGAVQIVVSHNLHTLSHLAGVDQVCGSNGGRGGANCRSGQSGPPARIWVPPGTQIFAEPSGELVLDTAACGAMSTAESEKTLLHGGRGGKGNHHFKGPRNQAPRFAQEGEPGQGGQFRLELRLIADIGLVGLPNAGKSSLQNLLTKARPRMGAYPFTTTIPNLGVLRAFDQELVIADIPGIIDGAAAGSGLGLQFLSHIARAAALLLIVDLATEDCAQSVKLLRCELKEYDRQQHSALQQKPWAILANKIDLIDLASAEQHTAQLRRAYPNIEIVLASCLDAGYASALQDFLLRLKNGQTRPTAAYTADS